jgi:hypothetical protein
MNAFVPLLAAVDFHDVVRIAVLLLLFGAPIVSRLVVKIKQIPPPAKRPIPPQPVPLDVADEIEEFMQRAAKRQLSPKGERRVASEQSSPAATVAEPIRAEVVAEKPVGGQVGDHVRKYLDEQEFSRREDALGKEVAQADKEIDQRLHQTFDHRVSELEAVPGEAAAPPIAYEPPDLVGTAADIPASFATGLLDLVGNPDSLRQAIILSEILHRPEERWV